MLLYQGPTVGMRSSSCPYRKKLSQRIIYILLGYFGVNPMVEGRRAMTS